MPLKPRTIAHDPSKFVRKIAIHSASGGGKSHLAATAQDVPQMANVYHLDIDGGFTTLKSRGDIQGEVTRRAVDVERVLWAFLNREPDTLGYNTLIVDGFTALVKNEFDAAMRAKGEGAEATWKDYGKATTLGVRIINYLRDLPITTIINLWSRVKQPNIEGTAKPNVALEPSVIAPDIPGGIEQVFIGVCDDVFYLHAREDKTRYLYTDKTKMGAMTVIAKMRDPILAPEFTTEADGVSYPVIKNPTFADLYARYQRGFAKIK